MNWKTTIRGALQALPTCAMIMSLAVLGGYASVAQGQNSAAAAKTRTTTAKTLKTVKPAADTDTMDVGVPWPPADIPPLLPGSILPAKRIVAFYGNPLQKRMGILGELPPDQMLAKLDKEVAAWTAADPEHPVQPALHLIAVVAQSTPGTSGKYRMRVDSSVIAQVYEWAKKKNALMFLDVQVGQGTLQEELPRLLPWLKNPDVHLAIDPEFSMKTGKVPGTLIGTFDAADVNYASSLLQDLVTQAHLPPKILIVHRFRRGMITNYKKIKLDSRVQIVINMDGWGVPSHKREAYRDYVYKNPVEYTGFKLFYHNDTKLPGSHLMTPAEVLGLVPKPLYIQYQ